MKTALITSAYRGLGHEVARQLSQRGWHIILTARNKNQGAAVASRLKNTSFVELDITDNSSATRAAQQVQQLDVLINNAGMISDGDQDIPSFNHSLTHDLTH